MSNRVQDTLAQLGAAFAVRDIMISYENFQLDDERDPKDTQR